MGNGECGGKGAVVLKVNRNAKEKRTKRSMVGWVGVDSTSTYLILPGPASITPSPRSPFLCVRLSACPPVRLVITLGAGSSWLVLGPPERLCNGMAMLWS
jgi:hypothetical protein